MMTYAETLLIGSQEGTDMMTYAERYVKTEDETSIIWKDDSGSTYRADHFPETYALEMFKIELSKKGISDSDINKLVDLAVESYKVWSSFDED